MAAGFPKRSYPNKIKPEPDSTRSNQVLATVHRVRQPLQRAVEGGVLLGKTKSHDRGHRVIFVKRRNRYRRYFVVGDDAPAKRFVSFIEAKRRKVDGEEISPLGLQHRKSDVLEPGGETIPAPRQVFAHRHEIIVGFAEAVSHRDLKIWRRRESEELMHLRRHPQQG